MKDVALMFKAIHFWESQQAVREKMTQVTEKLKAIKLGKATQTVEDGT